MIAIEMCYSGKTNIKLCIFKQCESGCYNPTPLVLLVGWLRVELKENLLCASFILKDVVCADVHKLCK